MGFFDLFKKKTKVIMVGDVITVTLKNGNQLVFQSGTRQLFETLSSKDIDEESINDIYFRMLEDRKLAIKASETADGTHPLSEIIQRKEEAKQIKDEKKEEIRKEVAAVKEIQDKFPTLLETGDFEEKDGALYLRTPKGTTISLSIPKAMITKFLYLVEGINNNNGDALDQYLALKNFWMWCSLNPNANSRENLYSFIERNNLKINKHGFFFSYRMILSTNKNKSSMSKELITIISDSYLKIKKWKKSPANFEILHDIQDNSYFMQKVDQAVNYDVHGECDTIGNVATLYANLGECQEQMFTDNFSHRFDIRIGREVSQPWSQCDTDSSVTYSRGLHSGAESYGLYNGFGDTPVLIMINPMNVCAVPYDNVLRSCAYLPICIITTNNVKEVLGDANTLDIAEEYYEQKMQELRTIIETNSPEEIRQHNLLTTELSLEAMKMISKEAGSITKTLSKRVINA